MTDTTLSTLLIVFAVIAAAPVLTDLALLPRAMPATRKPLRPKRSARLPAMSRPANTNV